MEERSRCDAVIIIGCRREQVLEIIEHVKSRFPEIEVRYEIVREEVL